MDGEQALENIADRYRKEGYEVAVHPDASQLPAYLANTQAQVELLAWKGDHIIMCEAKQYAGEDAEPFEVAADLSADSVALLIEEAELLLNPRTLRSALVMAWAAFEAAARAVLKPSKAAFAGDRPRELIEGLRARRLIPDEDYAKLQESLSLRNAIVHGVRPVDVLPDLVPFLLRIARHLLNLKPSTPGIRLSASATAVIVRRRVNQSEFKELVEQATQLLFQLLGDARSSVSIDWELAEDGLNNPVLILKLSDANGAVAATFAPTELKDRDHMAERLNRLFGDLLEIRSHNQVKRLMSSSNTVLWRGPAA